MNVLEQSLTIFKFVIIVAYLSSISLLTTNFNTLISPSSFSLNIFSRFNICCHASCQFSLTNNSYIQNNLPVSIYHNNQLHFFHSICHFPVVCFTLFLLFFHSPMKYEFHGGSHHWCTSIKIIMVLSWKSRTKLIFDIYLENMLFD